METVEYEINVDVPDYAVDLVRIWCSRKKTRASLIRNAYRSLGSTYDHSFDYVFNGNKLCISLKDAPDAIDENSKLLAESLREIIKWSKDPIEDLKERIFEP